jgi:steroid 5-alpha reductase family enzyme
VGFSRKVEKDFRWRKLRKSWDKKRKWGKQLYTFVNLENEKKFFACMSDGH